MKRDPSLTALSRDHHQALFQALRLKRATEKDVADVGAGVLEFFDDHGLAHFRAEEEVLLPAFARHADPGQDAVVRVLVDHVWIRERLARLRGDQLALDEMRELGERLDAHVRHEERVLFPLVEEALPAAELAVLGAELDAAEG